MHKFLFAVGVMVLLSGICNAKIIDINALNKPYDSIAENAEVVLVSGYTTRASERKVKVIVDRPAANVILVLTSHDQVAWLVEATEGTKISAVVVSGNSKSSIDANFDTVGLGLNVTYIRQADSFNFKKLINSLYEFLLVDKISSFKSSYTIPDEVLISSMDKSNDEMTLFGVNPEKPKRIIDFHLTTLDYFKVGWGLEGPTDNAEHAYIDLNRTAVVSKNEFFLMDAAGGVYYKKSKYDGVLIDGPQSGNPSKSNVIKAISFDTKRKVLAAIKSDGLSRYSMKERKWVSFSGGYYAAILSLCYDKKKDRYVGLSVGRNQELILSNFDESGEYLYSVEISYPPPGLGELIEEGNPSGPLPTFNVVSEGDDVVLVAKNDFRVTNIWYLDLRLETGTLTYKNRLPVFKAK